MEVPRDELYMRAEQRFRQMLMQARWMKRAR